MQANLQQIDGHNLKRHTDALQRDEILGLLGNCPTG